MYICEKSQLPNNTELLRYIIHVASQQSDLYTKASHALYKVFLVLEHNIIMVTCVL